MTKLTGAALDQAVANVLGIKSVHNCEKWKGGERTWVGLTEQQRNDIENDFEVFISIHVFDAIEAKLKQNNGYAKEKNT